MKKLTRWFIIMMLLFSFAQVYKVYKSLASLVGGGSSNKTSEKNSETTKQKENNSSGKVKNSYEITSDTKLVTDKKQKLNVGEVIRDGDLYVGLAHVKKSHTYTYMNIDNSVASGYDAVYAFIEIFNSGDKNKSISTSKFSVYADSEKVGDIDVMMELSEDGVKQLDSYSLEGGTKLVYLLDSQILEGWKELDIFYDNYSWHISSEDVSTTPYTQEPIIHEVVNRPIDEVGKTFSSDEYEVTFDGFTIVPPSYSFNDNRAVFKYTIKNISDEKLELNLIGYKMKCYVDNYLVDDGASYIFDDTVDGYLNIYNVKEIQPGMSAKIYVAFDTKKNSGTFYNIFDTGYIISKVIGTVNIEY